MPVAVCESAADADGTQSLSVFLSVLFALYLVCDSVVVGLVLSRKSKEAESLAE